MENEGLGTLIEVEREIHERIEREKKKAVEWLETVRNQSLESLMKEEEELKASIEKAMADAAVAAEREALEIVQHARAEAERLRGITEDLLQVVVRKHIVRILPEAQGQT
jgi:vacuolar-type H+-ATPase subunit H